MKAFVSSIRTYVQTEQRTLALLAAGNTNVSESEGEAAVMNMKAAYSNAQQGRGEACAGW